MLGSQQDVAPGFKTLVVLLSQPKRGVKKEGVLILIFQADKP